MSASWALQKAVYARLAADAPLAAEIGTPPRIYDAPPADAAFPYIVLGEGHAAPLAGHEAASEHDVRIGIVSRHAGRRDIRRIADRLYDALHDADFPVEGHRLVNCRFVFADAFRRGETHTHTGAVRFRAVIEKSA